MDTDIREYTSPDLVDASGIANLPSLVEERLQRGLSRVTFRRAANGDGASTTWEDITAEGFLKDARRLARHFIAAGVRPGDSVALMGPTSYAWTLSDVAALWAGAVVVPIYDTSAPSQVRAIVSDAEVTHAIAGTSAQAAMLAESLGSKERVWSMEISGSPDFRSLESLLAADPDPEVSDEELEAARSSRTQDDVATIVYTSGTTSSPKGVLLTHGNFVTQVLSFGQSHRKVLNEFGSTILFLPLSHVLARMVQYACLVAGMEIAHLSDTKKIIGSFSELHPTFVMVVPRVLEKILTAAGKKAEAKHLGALWADARVTAERAGKLAEDQELNEFATPKMPLSLKVRHLAYEAIFYSKIRTLLGGNIQYILCGGAKLHPDLALVFRGMGVPVIEGYGLTESTGPLAGNLPGDLRAGYVGPPAAGTTVRISDEGEVLAKGPGISPGYRNPEHTKAAFSDGFFHTGDLGSIDAKGRICINGRIKDVIVTSGGKTIEPAGWEGTVEKHPGVAYAVAVGDDRPYLTALLVQQDDDADASDHDEPTVELIENPKLVADLHNLINEANNDVSRTERIKKFAVVRANLASPELMTPSMKLKRAAFLEKARHAIEELYEKVPGHHVHEISSKDEDH